MKPYTMILFLLLTGMLNAQDTLTLIQCLDGAVAHAPRLQDKQLLNEQGELTLSNIRSAWYPELNLNGKITYQSDVVSIEPDQAGIPLAFPEMPHEQYGMNLDVRQTLYDGGLTKQQKKYEQAAAAMAIGQVDVDLYALRERVTDLYFSVLLLQETRENLEIILENLKAREQVLRSSVEHGVAGRSDLRLISVEILKTLQSISELDARRGGLLRVIGIYMGRAFDEQVMLDKPYFEWEPGEEMERPELEWFDLRSNLLESVAGLAEVKRMPRVFAYGQAGVGRPGYNMLNDDFDSYYMVGAGVQWNIWDWNQVKREKQILEKKQQMIGHTREAFSMNTRAGMEQQVRQMEHYRNTLSLDEKMLEIRISITGESASRLENGVITATDYLQVLNQENMARTRRSTHQLQLLKAMAYYKLLNGTL